jgi:hypothetical protein
MILRNTAMESDVFINKLSNQEIVVYEDVQASKIWCNYANGTWNIRPKNINQTPVNIIDLATQKYYKWAWAYLLSLPNEVTDLIRPNMYFCFEYFPDEQPANIRYDRIPKNHLILTCICKYGKVYSRDVNELNTYADLLGVETLPIIYKGRLSDKQLSAINFFLNTSEKDLSLVFKESNFAEFFYKILNPFTQTSYLKTSGYQNNLEKIIIRFTDEQQEITMEILNPLYQKMVLKTDSEFSDVYSILLFNFMQWLLTIDLDTIEVHGTVRELVYINLISKLFNMYVDKNRDNILQFKFVVPAFFNTDKFRINQALIQDKTTIQNVNTHSKLEYLLKILLSSFQRPHKQGIGIINEIALEHLNTLVRKIQVRVESVFNYNTKLSHYSKLTDMSKFPNIKWETDAKGYVYPEIGSLFGDTNATDDKKKLTKKSDKL